MRCLILLAAALLAAGAPATAGETVGRGPPPAWVEVEEVTVPSADEALGEAPVRTIWNDEQVRIEGRTKSVYWHFAMLLQTPDGLSAGNINFPWSPDVDEVVIHSLLIRRGSETIDVLASQDFIVVRSEPNIEQAMLDGVLTASIQPEGLQVGDIIEFSGTIATTDPVFDGNVEYINFNWNPAPIDRARIRASWPRRQPIRHLVAGDIAQPAVTTADGWSSIAVTATGIEPFAGPRGAPGRFQAGRVVSLSSFDSWAAVSRLMAPHYESASRLSETSPLRREIERIAAASTDPVARAEAALVLVESRVRYVALLSGLGGLVPASADESWSRRFGDCKGKTALLLALLRELGIEAEAVLVNSGGIDGIDAQLPQIGLFNHVIVRARIGGRDYWLDGTRTGDRRLAALPVPYYFVGLPIRSQGSELIDIIPPPLDAPAERLVFEYDGSAGVAARLPMQGRMEFTGDAAIGMNLALAAMTATQRTTAMEAYWRNWVSDIEIAGVDFTYDAETPKAMLSVRGTTLLDWERRGWRPIGTQMGFTPDFTRSAGPDRDAPFVVDYPAFGRTEVSLILPTGAGMFRIQGEPLVEQRVAGIEYSRSASIRDNRFTMVNSSRSIAREFPAGDAPQAATALRALTDKDLVLVAPAAALITTATPGAATASGSGETADFDSLMEQSAALADSGNLAEAIATATRALPLASADQVRDVRLHRAYLAVTMRDFAAAQRDLDVVLATEPDHQPALLVQSELHLQSGKALDALATLERVLAADPGSIAGLNGRAHARRMTGDNLKALADADASLAISQDQPRIHLLRANILGSLNRRAEVLRVADEVVAGSPESGYAWVVAALIFRRYDDRIRALAAYDRAIELEPEGYVYLNRSESRPAGDHAARLADIEQALALDPALTDAWLAKAALQTDMGDAAGAAQSLTAALADDDDNAVLLNSRGIALSRAGRAAEAQRDFTAARAAATNGIMLNRLCWDKAMAGIALERALEECTAALALLPDSGGIIDSRGWAYVRMERPREAIADFDRALALAPEQAGSLYGRAMAWTMLGDKAKARADRDAAFALSPSVDREFRDAGLVLTLD